MRISRDGFPPATAKTLSRYCIVASPPCAPIKASRRTFRFDIAKDQNGSGERGSCIHSLLFGENPRNWRKDHCEAAQQSDYRRWRELAGQRPQPPRCTPERGVFASWGRPGRRTHSRCAQQDLHLRNGGLRPREQASVFSSKTLGQRHGLCFGPPNNRHGRFPP